MAELQKLIMGSPPTGFRWPGLNRNGVVRCDQGPGQYMLWEVQR
jgi:hypothetical protein